MQQVKMVEQLGKKQSSVMLMSKMSMFKCQLFILYKTVRNISSSVTQVDQDATMVWYTWHVWKLTEN